MSKKEELIEFLHGELYNPYCYNCRWDDADENEHCDWCNRKSIGWQVSEGVVDRIVEIAMRKEE